VKDSTLTYTVLWCEAWRGATGVAHSLPVLPCLWWRSHTGDVVEFLYFCLICLRQMILLT